MDDNSFRASETAREDLYRLKQEIKLKRQQTADPDRDAELKRQLDALRDNENIVEDKYSAELEAKHRRDGKII
jgi:hypothetical protein